MTSFSYLSRILEEGNHTKIKPKLDYVIPLINGIVTYIKDAPVCIKIKLIGAIFPEKKSNLMTISERFEPMNVYYDQRIHIRPSMLTCW